MMLSPFNTEKSVYVQRDNRPDSGNRVFNGD
jgi:hypothetical protein